MGYVLGYRSDYGKGTGVRIPLGAKKKKKKKTFFVEVTTRWGLERYGNSYRHGIGHKCSRWRPRVHPVNTYLFIYADLG